MGMRPVTDPYASPDSLIDRELGSTAYKKVRLVAENIAKIDLLAASIGDLEAGTTLADAAVAAETARVAAAASQVAAAASAASASSSLGTMGTQLASATTQAAAALASKNAAETAKVAAEAAVTAAAASATTATTGASTATAKAVLAAGSATDALAYANNAAATLATVTTKAQEAAASATAAAASATAAGTSATNSATSAAAAIAAAAYRVSIAHATYAGLAAVVGTSGQSAGVFADAGTHTDPVAGGTVANEGIYAYSTAPAGWRRVAALPAGGMNPANNLADVANVVTARANLQLGSAALAATSAFAAAVHNHDSVYYTETEVNALLANYASLDGGGKVPASQLPSYVDDVVEYPDFASLPTIGVAGVLYVLIAPHTNAGITSSQFRWSGSAYAPIIASPGSTDAVTEGSTNLYFTQARARAAISVTGNLTYNSGTGLLTGPDLTPYLTAAAAATTYQPITAGLSAFLALGATGIVKKTGANTYVLDTSAYITNALGNTNLTGIKNATFNSQPVIASTSGAITIDWTTGQNQLQTEPTGSITYTFTAPPGPCHLQLLIASDGVSTAQTFVWPASVIWYGAQYSAVANKKGLVSFYYDGTNYHVMGVNQL